MGDIIRIFFYAAVAWSVSVGFVVGVWVWWLRRDTRRYQEYLHRAGLKTIPSPRGQIPVPSDDDLRKGLQELGLDSNGNPEGPQPPTVRGDPWEELDRGRGPEGSPGGPLEPMG